MLNLKKILAKILKCCYKEETITKDGMVWKCRVYADGYVDAIGRFTFSQSHYIQSGGYYGHYTEVSTPYTMADVYYYCHSVWIIGNGFAWNAGGMNQTTTKFNAYALASASGTQNCQIITHLAGKRAT